jgi:hypothetical protein
MHQKVLILKNTQIKMIQKLSLVLFVLVLLQSCTSVKEYEKEKINDVDMKLASRTAEKYETTFQVYREAAAGANGGKSGGGCGCN